MMPVMSVLVALIALTAAGRRVEASCGDWLAGHPGSAESPLAMAVGEVATPLVPGPTDAPPLPECDGPACRGVPFLPALPRDVSVDAPRHDPADRAVVASIGGPDVGRRFPAGNDRKPVSFIAAVPIRPPRRASLQA